MLNVRKGSEWLYSAILDASHKIAFARCDIWNAACLVGSGRYVCQALCVRAVHRTGVSNERTYDTHANALSAARRPRERLLRSDFCQRPNRPLVAVLGLIA